MTYDSSSLSSVHTIDSPVFVFTTDGSTLLVANRGTLSSSAFHVPSVAHIPRLTKNLISGSQIVDSHCRVIVAWALCMVLAPGALMAFVSLVGFIFLPLPPPRVFRPLFTRNNRVANLTIVLLLTLEWMLRKRFGML
jgi:hypothetical protein